jgi:hypothetical protein
MEVSFMSNAVKELQERQLGGLHEFFVDLGCEILDALYDRYGEEMLDTVGKMSTDMYGMYRWHLERVLAILDTLSAKYGYGVVDAASEKIAKSRHDEGKKLAGRLGKNSLEDYIMFSSHGNKENIIKQQNDEAFIKCTGCLSGRIAHELGRSDVLFKLYCKSDHDFLRGFNENLDCEHIKTLMYGDDCCIHKLYIK